MEIAWTRKIVNAALPVLQLTRSSNPVGLKLVFQAAQDDQANRFVTKTSLFVINLVKKVTYIVKITKKV